MTGEWYRHVVRWVNCAFQKERRTRRRLLALVSWAVLRRRSVCLSELARALPGPVAHHHKKKRLYRFLSQGSWEPFSLLWGVLPRVLERFGFRRGQVPLSLDGTPLRPQEQAFVRHLVNALPANLLAG